MEKLTDSASKSPGGGYSIRVASRLSGISADTLRMWERRYGFPRPERTDTGIRVYSNDDIERLILLSRALKAGFRAGEVIERPCDELKELLKSSIPVPAEAHTSAINAESILRALKADDANLLRSEIRQAVATLGPRQFLTEVAAPLLERVGDEWAAGRIEVRHEHLLSETLSTQLRLLLSAYEANRGTPCVLLTTLTHEQHGLGLEMAALYLALAGAVPRLLGVDTPPDQVVEAARALHADVVGLSVSASSKPTELVRDLDWMLGELPEATEIWLGGQGAASINFDHPRARVATTWLDLDRELHRLRTGE